MENRSHARDKSYILDKHKDKLIYFNSTTHELCKKLNNTELQHLKI